MTERLLAQACRTFFCPIIESAFGRFGEWIEPRAIPNLGIDALAEDLAGYKLIARVTRMGAKLPCASHPNDRRRSLLSASKGPENRVEIKLLGGGAIRLRAQDAAHDPVNAMRSLTGTIRLAVRCVGNPCCTVLD